MNTSALLTWAQEKAPSALERVVETLLLQGSYNTNVVLIATALFGFAAAVVGCFAMLKKQSLVADAFAHASLLGVTSAFLIHSALEGKERSVPVLLLGAALSGGMVVVAVEWLTRRTRLTADTATASVSSATFGAGIVMLSIARRSGGADQAGLDGLIFGAAASMTRADAWLMAGIALATLAVVAVMIRPLTAVAFNARYARATGLPVAAVDAVLATLVASVTLAGLQAVGMLLVVALLVTPAAAARLWARRVLPMIAIAGAMGAAAGWVGVALSASIPNAPTGALVVLVAATIFMLSLLLSPTRGLLAGVRRRQRLQRAARSHLKRAIDARA